MPLRSRQLALLLTLAALPGPAQTNAPAQPLTLSVNSRLVFEDVLVTDRNGEPVHGLPATAFHLTDNGVPQVLRSFEEGSVASTVPTKPLPPGTFTDVGSTDVHSASEVLLLDADSMRVEDQDYLLGQLDKALPTLPANLQVAVFRIANGRLVEIRGLGNDRADTRRALRESLPVLTQSIDDPFNSTADQLLTVAAYLQATPGRKNILWFGGAFPLVSFVDQPNSLSADVAARTHILHELQEALAEARVSVYPVDVRGVIPFTLQTSPSTSTPGSRAPQAAGNLTQGSISSSTGGPLGFPTGSVLEQRNQMRNIAEATGGKAYTLNHVGDEIIEAFDLGARAYALSYSPIAYTTDDSWHRVRITIDPATPGGPFQLSYRSGYLASWSGLPGGRVGVRLIGGTPLPTSNNPKDDPATPLPFLVRIVPGTPTTGRKPALPLDLHFFIPVDEVTFKRAGDRWRNELLIASYAYNTDGKIKIGRLQQYVTSLTDEQFARARHLHLPATQTLTVPANASYLMLEMRDAATKRVGDLMLPMRAVRTLPSAPPAGTTSPAAPAPSANPTPRATPPQAAPPSAAASPAVSPSSAASPLALP